MKNPVIFIFILSIILFLVITIIRIVMTIAVKQIIDNIFYKLFKKSHTKTEDLVRDIDQEIEQELQKEHDNELKNVVRINEKEIEEEPDYTKHIIGVVEPKGYWTSLIMAQKIKNMVRNSNKIKQQNNKGYHNTMRFSKDESQSRDRGL